MKIVTPEAISDSIRDNARARGIDTQQYLKQLVMTQLLFRMSEADGEDRLILKGGMVWWLDESLRAQARPTVDIDIHFYKPTPTDEVLALLRVAFAIDRGDGMTYEIGSVDRLEHTGEHEGVRIKVRGIIADGTRARRYGDFHIDVGFGGTRPEHALRQSFPSPHPRLAPGSMTLIPQEFIVAEKFSAIVKLGDANTRLKDYNDIYVLWSRGMNLERLGKAIAISFADRRQVLPEHTYNIEGLSLAYARKNQEQWRVWLAQALRSEVMPENFLDVVRIVDEAITTALPYAHGYSHPDELDLAPAGPQRPS